MLSVFPKFVTAILEHLLITDAGKGGGGGFEGGQEGVGEGEGGGKRG